MSVRTRNLAMAVAGVLAMAATAAAGPLQDDLAARRARLMEKLGPDALAIVWSAPTKVYSLDVDYEFRQDSHLLYLTGMTQEETILVLMPGSPHAARRSCSCASPIRGASTGTATS